MTRARRAYAEGFITYLVIGLGLVGFGAVFAPLAVFGLLVRGRGTCTFPGSR